jgi:hypothetical protein
VESETEGLRLGAGYSQGTSGELFVIDTRGEEQVETFATETEGLEFSSMEVPEQSQ